MTEGVRNGMSDDGKAARGSVRRHRVRRFTTGLNVCVAVLLALVVTVMANILAYRYNLHWDLSWEGYYKLSDKTCSLLADLDAEVDVVAFFQSSHGLFEDVRNLLQEYEYEASKAGRLNLRVEVVDPDRDLARARDLTQKYDLDEANVVVFACGARKRYVEAKDIVDYDALARARGGSKIVAFKGEQVFSSAIQSVVRESPVVYFLSGHGEHDLGEYSRQWGYSTIARIMRRENVDVQPLVVAERHGVPDNASAVVIAGPATTLAQFELDLLSDYLGRNGRLFVLIDKGAETGLDPLLKEWGVALASDAVVDPRQSVTGRELIVTRYGDHAITRHFRKLITVFYMPRSVSPLTEGEGAARPLADRPRVSALVSTSSEGWAEADLEQNPPKFDAGVDVRGPVSVCMAVEKGPVSGIEVEIKPTRLVVVGDSYFVSNAALAKGGGGNIDFFMAVINWLVEREELMAISPRDPMELRVDMSRTQRRLAALVLGAAPLAAAFLGFFVWLVRRY